MPDPTFTYNPAAGGSLNQVRLLINDVDETRPVFEDVEVNVFLTLVGGVVLLAAAQALDTIADNEVLTSKVIRTQDLQTDGAKVADSLRARAQRLREQHAATVDDADDGFFDIVDTVPGCGPELGWL